MKINIHKDTRVITWHFTLADDAMFYIIWYMVIFFFFLCSQLKIMNDKKSLVGS